MQVNSSSAKSYSLTRILGEGSFGRVYECYDDQGNRFALKRVVKTSNKLGREMSIVKDIDHPCCLKVVETFYSRDSKGTIWQNMVFPFYPKTLKDEIAKGRMHLDHIKRVSRQICVGLKYLHSKNICHRDLTPANILITSEGNAVIGDFGSAKYLTSHERHITYVTARYYRAPELLLGSRDYDHRVDVWSFGNVLFEMVFGKPIFRGIDDSDQILKIMSLLGTPSIVDYSKLPKQMSELLSKFPKLEAVKFRNILPLSLHDLADLFGKIFVYNYEKRITAEEILEHPFLCR